MPPPSSTNQRNTKAAIGRLASDYGMFGVLILLCAFYAFATLTEQTPRGRDAAESVLKQLESSHAGGPILVIIKNTPVDRRFSSFFQASEAGEREIRTISGEPSDIRRELEALGPATANWTAVVTTSEYATVVNNLLGNSPTLSALPVVTPESYRWPTFLLADNLRNVANQIVVIAIIAVGMTMVIITAGIDLSVGSLVAFSAVAAAWLIQRLGALEATTGDMLLASLGAILACAGIGLFSGVTITVFKIPPFIATLGVMQIASGFAYIISGGESIYEIPDGFVWLGRGTDLFSVPNAVVLMVIIYGIAHIVMTRTTLGRYIYAVGGNPEAARLSGIRVGLILLFVYAVCGALSGLGGVVLASQLKSGAPTYGLMYELYVIAAVVIGGTSLFGGEGRVLGTLIGAFIIGVIQNGMNLTGVESYTQKVVLGFVILGAVVLDMLKKRRWRRFLPTWLPGRGT